MAFFKQVGLTLRQGQIDIDLRVQLRITGHQWRQELDPQPGGGLHA